MIKRHEKKDKILKNIIDIAKLTILILIGVVFYSYLLQKNNITFDKSDIFFQMRYITIALGVALGIYCIWIIMHLKKIVYKNIIVNQIVENIFFITVITTLIILSNNSILQYKYLYIFVIIISTIEIGLKAGIIISTISSALTLAIDIIFLSSNIINQLFQNDLIIVGVFISVALPLGYYVEIEKEKLEEKDLMLNELSNEVKAENLKRKKFEESLLKNKACYDLLIHHARDAIFVHRNNRIIFANDSAVELLGYKDEEDLINKSILEFKPDDDKDTILGVFKSLYEGDFTEIVSKGKIKKNNGKTIDVESTSTFFTYQGESTILTLFRDISYEKEVEKLQDDVKENIKLLNESRAYTKMITEFFSNISHELKTPLNLIYSSIQLIEVYEDKELNEILKNTQEQNENRKKYLGVIKQNCLRLIRLINNLLDISKLDSGFLKLNASNQDIVSAVEMITMSVVPYGESKGISIVFDTNIEEKIIACDTDKIERIILNLLSNAIKFTNTGGSIFVNIVEEYDYIIISIKDTGVGMPKEDLSRIFDRFIQVDKTLGRNIKGTGLGLSIVKSFVEMHNGKIEVRSEYGEGSEFIIKLPNKMIEDNSEEKKSIGNINAVYTEFSGLE